MPRFGRVLVSKNWQIRVYRNIEIAEEIEVPINRLSDAAAKDLLKALVAKHENLNIDELTMCFLNKRRGLPSRSSMLDARPALDLEKAKNGYWVCGPTISAFALWELSAEAVTFMRQTIQENRGS